MFIYYPLSFFIYFQLAVFVMFISLRGCRDLHINQRCQVSLFWKRSVDLITLSSQKAA